MTPWPIDQALTDPLSNSAALPLHISYAWAILDIWSDLQSDD